MMREERVRVYFARPTIAIAKIRLLGIYKEYGVWAILVWKWV